MLTDAAQAPRSQSRQQPVTCGVAGNSADNSYQPVAENICLIGHRWPGDVRRGWHDSQKVLFDLECILENVLLSPNLRDLERPYLVADLGGRRHSVVGVLATWCYPARRRRPPQRSIWRPNRYHVAEVAGSFWLHLQCHIRHFPWSGAFLGDTPT